MSQIRNTFFQQFHLLGIHKVNFDTGVQFLPKAETETELLDSWN